MTTLTMHTPAAATPSLQRLAWRRMIWVTWRQHRVTLTGLAVLLAALAGYVWFTGLQLHHAYRAATGCHPAGSLVCDQLIATFNNTNKVIDNGYVLQAVPALIGAFVGAPVLARELEAGTFRYAWTQGFGRTRWTVAKVITLAIAVTAASAALSALLSWYYQPYLAAGRQALPLSQSSLYLQASPFTSGLFDLRGVALPAWTLAAFTIGALAGTLIRRVVPAIVATLLLYTGLAITTAKVLRPHYFTALLTSKLNLPASAWITEQYGTKDGHVAFRGDLPGNLLFQYCPPSAVGSGKPSRGTLGQCLTQHGYTLWTRYQPASRYWDFQSIEGTWLLALAMLLTLTTVWTVRHRAT